MYGMMQESGLTEILYIYNSAILGQYPELFLCAPQREWLQPDGCWIASIVLLHGCHWGSEIHIWRAEISDDCDILVY